MASGYWADQGIQPKRQYKWILQFSELGGAVTAPLPQWVVKTVSKPSFTIGEASHSFINHTFHFPGKLTWSAIDLTMVDPITPNASDALIRAIKASGYEYPGDNNAASAGVSFSKAAATSTLGEVKLIQLGNKLTEKIEEWTLKNAWIKDVNFGSLSYDTEELTTISMTLRYDWAQYEKVSG